MKEREGLKVAILLGLMTVLSPLFALWSGFVMWKIYGWFLASIPGAPDLKPIHFIGIASIVGLCTTHLYKSDDKEQELSDVCVAVIAKALVMPLTILAFAWIYWRLLA